MRNNEVKELKHGAYKVFWKSGGFSIAAVGSCPNGNRCVAPSNWVGFSLDEFQRDPQYVWEEVLYVKKLA